MRSPQPPRQVRRCGGACRLWRDRTGPKFGRGDGTLRRAFSAIAASRLRLRAGVRRRGHADAADRHAHVPIASASASASAQGPGDAPVRTCRQMRAAASLQARSRRRAAVSPRTLRSVPSPLESPQAAEQRPALRRDDDARASTPAGTRPRTHAAATAARAATPPAPRRVRAWVVSRGRTGAWARAELVGVSQGIRSAPGCGCSVGRIATPCRRTGSTARDPWDIEGITTGQPFRHSRRPPGTMVGSSLLASGACEDGGLLIPIIALAEMSAHRRVLYAARIKTYAMDCACPVRRSG